MNRTLVVLFVALLALALLFGAACKPYMEKLDAESKKKRQVNELNARVEEHLSRAVQFANKESYTLAADEYRAIISKYPDFGEIAEIYYNLSEMLYALEDRDGQIENLHEVLERKPEHEKALFDLASAYEFKGNLAKAEEYALLAIRVNSNQPKYVNLLEKIRSRREAGD
jgi:tetratricopeptide (TPR) repeat protein